MPLSGLKFRFIACCAVLRLAMGKDKRNVGIFLHDHMEKLILWIRYIPSPRSIPRTSILQELGKLAINTQRNAESLQSFLSKSTKRYPWQSIHMHNQLPQSITTLDRPNDISLLTANHLFYCSACHLSYCHPSL